MSDAKDFLREHNELSRRFFLRCGAALAAGSAITASAAEPPAELAPVLEKLESYFTTQEKFGDVSRGRPVPHTLSPEKKKEVGLTRDTWKLDIVADPDTPATLGKQFARKDNTAIDFAALMKLGEKHAVRFAKVMTCLNIGCPLGMGVWEGVPLRTLLWLTQPKENLRRVFYYGYHNDDPKQQFRSSLPVGRVLEDYDDLPPVIVCYKLNGEWLTPERGGPVRIVVPEHYGYKSVKWLTHIVLTNLYHANDTYGTQNNDVDSPMKTFAATLHVPGTVKANAAIPITGYAQSASRGCRRCRCGWRRREKVGRPTIRISPPRPGPTRPFFRCRRSSAVTYRTARSRRTRWVSTRRASRRRGRCGWRRRTGRRCYRGCRRASTRCAAARSTRRVRPNRCRARSRRAAAATSKR